MHQLHPIENANWVAFHFNENLIFIKPILWQFMGHWEICLNVIGFRKLSGHMLFVKHQYRFGFAESYSQPFPRQDYINCSHYKTRPYPAFRIHCVSKERRHLGKFKKFHTWSEGDFLKYCFKKLLWKTSQIPQKISILDFLFNKAGCRPTAYNFIENEIPAQVFSCEICEIYQSNFFAEHCRQLLLFDLRSINLILFTETFQI